jgi:hypothetical protein
MGVFVSRTGTAAALEEHLAVALMSEPPEDEAVARDRARPIAAAVATAGRMEVHWERIVGAFVLSIALAVGAVIVDANDWVDEEGRMFDWAGTVLGVIVGYLTGEAVVPAHPANRLVRR